jgi:hypothetical protein
MRISRPNLSGILLLGLLGGGGCASAGGPDHAGDFDLVPGTTYTFSGSLPGVHTYQNRHVDFTVPVNGELVVYSETSATLLSSHGACGTGGRELRIDRRGSTYTFSCTGIRLELTPAANAPALMVWGSVEQEYERQGQCLVWNTDPSTGRRTTCAERALVVSTRTAWSGPVAVAVTVTVR